MPHFTASFAQSGVDIDEGLAETILRTGRSFTKLEFAMIRRPKTIAALAIAATSLATSAAQAQDMPALPPPADAPSPSPPGYGPPPGPPPGYGQPPPPPSIGPGTPAARGATADVQFEPDEPGVRLLDFSGGVPFERIGYGRGWYHRGWYGQLGWAPVYSPICNQPCTTRLAPGQYRLALAKDGGPAIPVFEPVVIGGPSTLHAYYTDRSGLRAAGWVISVAGIVGGIVMIVASANSEDVCDDNGNCYTHETANVPLLAGGIGVLVVSGIVGSILAFQHDEAHITIEPLKLPGVGAIHESALAGLAAEAPPQGAALSVRF
jgi:hypothetical protein